jgi:hypothetical protein
MYKKTKDLVKKAKAVRDPTKEQSVNFTERFTFFYHKLSACIRRTFVISPLNQLFITRLKIAMKMGNILNICAGLPKRNYH